MSKLYLYAAGLLLIAAALGGLYLKGRSDGRNSAEAKYSAAIATATQAARQRERDAAAQVAELDRQLIEQSRRLTAADGSVRKLEADLRAAVRAEPQRLCVGASGSMSGARADPSEPDAATGGDGQGAGAAPDLAAQLAEFARRCEQDRLTVLAWQQWSAVLH